MVMDDAVGGDKNLYKNGALTQNTSFKKKNP